MTLPLELPEIETIRRDLDREISGRKVKEAEAASMAVLGRYKNRKSFTSSLAGLKVRSVRRLGLHLLVDAFLELHEMPGMDQVQLRIAGWLGAHRRDYVEQQFDKLRSAGLGGQFQYDGAVDRQGKLDFLDSIDLLSVPTVYEEPKGLFVLESLAAGVPVVQPRHGAFPELLSRTGGGLLVDPGDTSGLATCMAGLLSDPAGRKALGDAGQKRVHESFNAERMGAETLAVLARIAAAR